MTSVLSTHESGDLDAKTHPNGTETYKTMVLKKAGEIKDAIAAENVDEFKKLIEEYSNLGYGSVESIFQTHKFIPIILNRRSKLIDEAAFGTKTETGVSVWSTVAEGRLRSMLPSNALTWFSQQPDEQRAGRLKELIANGHLSDLESQFSSWSLGGHSGYEILDKFEPLTTFGIVDKQQFAMLATNICVYARGNTSQQMAKVILEKKWTTAEAVEKIAIGRTFRGFDYDYWIGVWGSLLPICRVGSDAKLTQKIQEQYDYMTQYKIDDETRQLRKRFGLPQPNATSAKK